MHIVVRTKMTSSLLELEFKKLTRKNKLSIALKFSNVGKLCLLRLSTLECFSLNKLINLGRLMNTVRGPIKRNG